MERHHTPALPQANASGDPAAEGALTIADLRPALGDLNWQLRRAGLVLAVSVDGRDGRVVDAAVRPSAMFVGCDGCGLDYDPGRFAVPACPRCGTPERGGAVATGTGA